MRWTMLAPTSTGKVGPRPSICVIAVYRGCRAARTVFRSIPPSGRRRLARVPGREGFRCFVAGVIGVEGTEDTLEYSCSGPCRQFPAPHPRQDCQSRLRPRPRWWAGMFGIPQFAGNATKRQHQAPWGLVQGRHIVTSRGKRRVGEIRNTVASNPRTVQKTRNGIDLGDTAYRIDYS